MKFSFATTPEGFDNHIKKSIRNYEDLVSDTITFGNYFIEDNTNVYDLGCSTGRLLHQIKENQKNIDVNYIGLETCLGFEKFKDIEIHNEDIRHWTYQNASLITSIFTLQFIPLKDRAKVIESVYHGLNEGGAFIFAEKIQMQNSKLHEMMIFNYYDYKRKHFSEKEILEKEKELRNIMKPVTKKQIEEELSNWNWRHVDVFWQSGLFVGYLAIK
jgi:tRNA (cmo5U34)-methyltransferase|tara:strand:+ start:48 stop:692 length:645 start_codon:yes stop_codon:yes gene_type:complete